MSIFLILCVLAAAGWLVLSVRSREPGDDPGDTIAAYSRAMAALDPTDQPARRQAPRVSAARAGHRAAGTHRRSPMSQPSRRARPTAARSRPVRR